MPNTLQCTLRYVVAIVIVVLPHLCAAQSVGFSHPNTTQETAFQLKRQPCFAPLPREAAALKTTFDRDEYATRQWSFVRQALACYYDSNHEIVASAAFSHNLHILAERSYHFRKGAPGGFAGSFVRDAFLQAAINIVENWDFWRVPLTEAQFRVGVEKVKACVLTSALVGAISDEDPFVVTIGAAGVCGEMAVILASEAAGDNHFDQHLTPAFRDHIRSEFTKIIAAGPPAQIQSNLIEKMKAISEEHEMQFEKALVPAINDVDELPEAIRAIAKETVPARARKLRFDTFRLVLGELAYKGLLRSEVADTLISTLPGQKSVLISGNGRVFAVSGKTSTGIDVRQGDTVVITATGRIIVGMFAGATGPDGIDGFENYSYVTNARHGALLARVTAGGNEDWMFVGSKKSFVAPKSGVLELLVNDADTSNNEGEFTVTVNILPRKR